MALLASRFGFPEPFIHDEFAYLLGSASDGVVPPCADLDLAVYLKSGIKPGWDRLNNIMQVAEDSVGCSVDVDVGILNTAGCVFRFEALKGRQLFVRPDNMEEFIRFFSMTCREYEDYMYRIERYHRYREELEQPAA